MCQRMHVQNHAYTNKCSCTYVCDVHKFSNPDMLKDVLEVSPRPLFNL